MAQSFSLRGQVVDEDLQAIAGAQVELLNSVQLQFTTSEGFFTFNVLTDTLYTLAIRSLGYAEQRVTLSPTTQNSVQVRLQPSAKILAEVQIDGTGIRSTSTSSQAVITVTRSDLDQSAEGSFVDALTPVAGINAINTGVGIAKPVIRGMSYNRIMVNDQGVKQEGQQWGSDHGLEIDQFDVQQVEIIKGPASLRYGSDAMGGVINILPTPFPERGQLQTEVKGIYQYNNNLRGLSAAAEGNHQGWLYRLRYSQQDFDNYRVPADRFTYAGFELPIYDERLRNTAGQERNFAFTTGLKRDWGQSTVKISRFHQRVGLFPGAVGIPSGYQLQRYDQRRSIGLPRQDNTHWKVLWNTQYGWDRSILEIDAGYQHNQRLEESLPHTQNVGQTADGTVAHDLRLRTYSLNARLIQEMGSQWTVTYGVQGQRMQNNYGGFEFLIPAFTTWQGGGFTLVEYADSPVNPRWQFNAGLRFDGGQHEILEHQQPLYDETLQPTGEFEQRNADLTRQFADVSGAVGAQWQPSSTWQMKLNVGTSFRMPTAIELASNGVHHGTFRHELGNPDLQSERGYQLDYALTYQQGKISSTLTPFVAYYDQYIYLAPTASFSRLPSGSQLTWEFRQADASFWGGEWVTNYQPISNLNVQASLEYVANYNLDFQLPLPLTPPFSALGEVTYQIITQQGWLQSLELHGDVRWVADQNRVDRNERATPGYTLLGGGISSEWLMGDTFFNIMVQVDNALNTQYLHHLSRYRLLNLPEPGRNVVVTLRVPLSFNLNS
ncbi:TonB-dependent receptor [Tunicatimonas pelagia]|uniref:TonB-dependent receptor n=1 Tax=Tunicatimonas pelagia TaxID=931531 RepID=UPI0026657092|nr:TonB-dependent receptor [Tunicatimonas pelagia]WKN44150.1 TonB-dependent receptor [Tunicatimonas pelagia]